MEAATAIALATLVFGALALVISVVVGNSNNRIAIEALAQNRQTQNQTASRDAFAMLDRQVGLLKDTVKEYEANLIEAREEAAKAKVVADQTKDLLEKCERRSAELEAKSAENEQRNTDLEARMATLERVITKGNGTS